MFDQAALTEPAPARLPAVGEDGNERGIREHGKGVIRGFVAPAVNGDSLVLHTVAVAVLAKEHAVPEARSYAGDMGREMEYASGEEKSFAFVTVVAEEGKSRVHETGRVNAIAGELNLV